MGLRELLVEIARPVRSVTLLLAMVVFFLLARLALAAGLIGLWLAIVMLPACFRYLIAVTEARIENRRIEPPGIELFNWVAGAWTLMPLFVLAAAAWGTTIVWARVSPVAAIALAAILLALYPSSIANLALTRSALGSLKPAGVVALIRVCGPRYFIIPAVVLGLGAVIHALARAGLSPLLVQFAGLYLLFLLFSLTGAIVAQSGAAAMVELPDPAEPDEQQIRAVSDRERTAVLDHAYGMISRGNRDGGLAHIQAYLDRSGAFADDDRWFFDAMLRWEDPAPALFFGQRYLSRLLDSNEQVLALKLVSRCLLADPLFKPQSEDRQRVLELAAAFERGDLLEKLRA